LPNLFDGLLQFETHVARTHLHLHVKIQILNGRSLHDRRRWMPMALGRE
jgi:hypothetical protein